MEPIMNKTQTIKALRWMYRLKILKSQIDQMRMDIYLDLECKSEDYRESEKGKQKSKDYYDLVDIGVRIDTAIDSLKNLDVTLTDGD
jgi:hypothetical protein